MRVYIYKVYAVLIRAGRVPAVYFYLVWPLYILYSLAQRRDFTAPFERELAHVAGMRRSLYLPRETLFSLTTRGSVSCIVRPERVNKYARDYIRSDDTD